MRANFNKENRSRYSMHAEFSHSVMSDSVTPWSVCSPPGSSVHGDSPGKNSGQSCHALLQEVFPNQGSNAGLPHCRWILYHLNHQGSPRIREGVACPVFRGSGICPLLQESNWGLLHCRWILYQLSYQGSPRGIVGSSI